MSARPRLTWLFVPLLALLLINGLGGVSPAAAQERSCYRLLTIDTTADLPANESSDLRKTQDWSLQNDGSYIVSFKAGQGGSDQGSTWHIWANDGKATLDGRRDGVPGSVNVTWSVPPEIWCSDQDGTLTASASVAGGDVWSSGLRYWSSGYPFQAADKTIVGQDPFQDVWVATPRFIATAKLNSSGTISLRPLAGQQSFTMGVYFQLSVNRLTFSVYYHYGLIQPEPRTAVSTSGGLPAGSGARNAALSMLPFGQLEPNLGTPGMALEAAQRRVQAGELVIVPVWLVKGANVANFNYELAYNGNVARPDGTIQKGNLLDAALFSLNPNTTSAIRAGFAHPSGISGTGTVTNIPFRAVGKVGDRTALTPSVTTVTNTSGGALAIDRIPGEIVIVAAKAVLPGDCDGDGAWTMLDALCAQEMSARLVPVRAVMDVDNSGDVTLRDAVIIAHVAMR
jgi:hypothetical protein